MDSYGDVIFRELPEHASKHFDNEFELSVSWRIWGSSITANPNSKWVHQKGRNFLMHAEDVELSPKLLMHDRDTKFTKEFDEIMKSTGCKIKKTPFMSPNLQTHVERADK